MNEENNLNNVTSVVPTPTPVENPTSAPAPVEIPAAAPVETPAPVEAPVAPVQTPVEPTPVAPQPVTPSPAQPTVNVTQVVNPAPFVESTNGGKKSNPIAVVLLIIALIGIIVYGLYQYTDILKPKDKTSKETTTTTTSSTTKAASKELIKTLDEYLTIAKATDSKELIINYSSALTYLDFDMANKCTADGANVSFNIGENKVEYSCKSEYDQAVCDNYWSTTVKVNDKFTKQYSSCNECASIGTFNNKNMYIDITQESCGLSMDMNHIKLYDANGTLIIDTTYSTYYSVKSDYSDQVYIKPVVKNNILYFLNGNATTGGTTTTCNLKYIDLNSSTPKVEDAGVSASCMFND